MENSIVKLLSSNIKCLLSGCHFDFNKLSEIRLRINEPIIFELVDGEVFLCCSGGITRDRDKAYRVTGMDIRATLDYISDYSLYAFEGDLIHGFITVKGGHRVGLAGQVVMENGRIKSVKHISFINIRVAHEITNCAMPVMPYIVKDNKVMHTLIISPPGKGKTTLLRDIIRCISNGCGYIKGVSVGVVDERSEIAACYMGIPQNDVGIRTDVLDGCPKADGMMMLIRSMNPKVIAVDEIGSREDLEAISYAINCGCAIIATIHGDSVDDIRERPTFRKLIDEKVFDRYIVLGDALGRVENIFDERGNELYIKSLCIAN